MKKWTNRQKIAGGVLLAAAAAFGLDRLTAADSSAAAGPPAAGADAGGPTGRPPAAPATRAGGGAVAAESAAAVARLAQRLDRAATAEGLVPGRTADAFSPPDAWFPPRVKPEAQPAGPAAVAVAASPTVDRAAEFKARHKLTAVMRGGSKGGHPGVAVLSGTGGGMAIRVGQAVDGFVLKAVRDSAAVLSDGEVEVELVLDRPAFSAVPVGP